MWSWMSWRSPTKNLATRPLQLDYYSSYEEEDRPFTQTVQNQPIWSLLAVLCRNYRGVGQKRRGGGGTIGAETRQTMLKTPVIKGAFQLATTGEAHLVHHGLIGASRKITALMPDEP
jgi:hypothetical protein